MSRLPPHCSTRNMIEFKNLPCGSSVDKTTRSLSHTLPKKLPGTLSWSMCDCFQKMDGSSIRRSILCSSHTLSTSTSSLSGRAASCEDYGLLYHPSRDSPFCYNYKRHTPIGLKCSVPCRERLLTRTSTPCAISRYHYPAQIFSDNRPPFPFAEYEEFLQRSGIQRVLISLHHPSSNDVNERFAQTRKSPMESSAPDSSSSIH